MRRLKNKVAFQGERGAFSEIAALKFFRNPIDPFPCKSFSEVFKKINNKEAEYGI
ncbi:MAG: prephenate dehydratase domain-containing protein, partial [Atribacterota bacterium]